LGTAGGAANDTSSSGRFSLVALQTPTSCQQG
jgi:hypothetical protein